MTPVVIVHGYLDSAARMRPLADHLRATGREVFCPSLHPSDGRVGIDQLAAQLGEFIAANLRPATACDLVGFSMGGIVCRYYLQRLDGIARTRRLITISSPHRGTVWAWTAPWPGIRQMSPGSRFLADLNATIHELAPLHPTSLWTPLDLMILPAASSRLPGIADEIVLLPAHFLMIRHAACLRRVTALLDEAHPPPAP